MKQERNYEQISNTFFKNLLLNTNWHKKTCKIHTYYISVKQSLVSIILYNGFSNNATDINDFLCKILGYW